MNKKEKIQKLLRLANDANDSESMSALAKAQELMLEYQISENELFDYKQQSKQEQVLDVVIYQGRPRKWLYRLASIIAANFRVRYYYYPGDPIELRFVGIASDIQIAEITFQYARGSVAKYMQQPEIKRKRKRKWQLKQDYIEGYLQALKEVFQQQVITNGYELALQLPDVVEQEVKKLNLIKGKDTSHKVTDHDAHHSGYKEGLKFKQRELIN